MYKYFYHYYSQHTVLEVFRNIIFQIMYYYNNYNNNNNFVSNIGSYINLFINYPINVQINDKFGGQGFDDQNNTAMDIERHENYASHANSMQIVSFISLMSRIKTNK